jgi:hypothetical protein
MHSWMILSGLVDAKFMLAACSAFVSYMMGKLAG